MPTTAATPTPGHDADAGTAAIAAKTDSVVAAQLRAALQEAGMPVRGLSSVLGCGDKKRAETKLRWLWKVLAGQTLFPNDQSLRELEAALGKEQGGVFHAATRTVG